MQFSSEKRQEKEKEFITLVKLSYRSKDCVIKKRYIIDSSILQENFSCVSKFLSCNREKTAVMR